MATIKISKFDGMAPMFDPTTLPPNNAAFAQNAYLYSGAVQGFHRLELLNTQFPLDSGTAYVFRFPKANYESHYMSSSYWVEFPGQDTNVLPPAVVGDTYERYYWAAPGTGPQYNTKARMIAGNSGANKPFRLGVPAPNAAMSLNVVGGSGATVSRVYAVTWVTAYGEEGPPKTTSLVSGFANGTWNLTGMIAPAYADRNITKTRIYRTVTSAQGVASFFLVAEVSSATTSYADNALDSAITGNQQLQSLSWYEPPSDLEGMASLPNGIIVGFRSNEVWFSEAYRPHAWPPQYALSVGYDIVGLGVYGQTVIVCTRGYPTAITGINPASMTMAKVTTFEPCFSRGSIVSTPEGVYYASPNGLILAANGRFTNITKDVMSKDKWQDMVPYATLRAARCGSAYMGIGTVLPGVFEPTAFETTAFEQEDFSQSDRGIYIDPANLNTITTIRLNTNATNLFNDPWTGEVLLVDGPNVQWFDVHSQNKPHEPFLWRSKIFQGQFRQNFEAVKVFFSIPAEQDFPDPTPFPINNDLIQTLQDHQYGLLRIYAGDRLIPTDDPVETMRPPLVATREIRVSGDQLRLPSGFKADLWQIEIEARVNVYNVQMATSARELRSV